MAKKIYIPKYDDQGIVTWYTYDASGNLVVTAAPDNQDVNTNPSTLIFDYSIDGECFKRIVTECLDCTDGQWDTEACYNEVGLLVACPDFSDETTHEKGCNKISYSGTESRFCYDPDGGINYTLPAIFRMASDGTFEYLNQEGEVITDMGCCVCCNTFCGNKWVDCNGECISLSCSVSGSTATTTEAVINNAFVIDPAWQVNNTKINFDDPNGTNAFADVGSNNWTIQQLVDVLNNTRSALPPTVPSGVDYTSTVWAAGPNYVYVVSGAVPTTLDLVSVPASINSTTI